MPRPVKKTTPRTVRKKGGHKYVTCRHCGKKVTDTTEKKHLKSLHLSTLSTPVYDYTAPVIEEDDIDEDMQAFEEAGDPGYVDNDSMDLFCGAGNNNDDVNINSVRNKQDIDTDNPPPSNRSTPDLLHYVLRSSRIPVEEVDESDEENNEEDTRLDEGHGVNWAAEAGWADDEELLGLSFEESLGEGLEMDAQELTEDELAWLRHYALNSKD